MYLRDLHIRGFRDLPDAHLTDLDRVVGLSGPGPEATAVGDALALAFSAFDHGSALSLARRWRLVDPTDEPEIEGDDRPEQLIWEDDEPARDLVASADEPSLSVRLGVALDPPLFRFLREQARRDPQLVTALSSDRGLTLHVSGLFARSFDALALHVHPIELGNVRVPVEGKDAAPWARGFFQRLAGRFVRADDDLAWQLTALEAAVSTRSHPAYRRWQAAFPDEYGVVRMAKSASGAPVLVADDQDARRWGRRLHDHARLAAAVHLYDADIVWAEAEDVWLDSTVAGESSALEQVWRVHQGGNPVEVTVSDDTPRTAHE